MGGRWGVKRVRGGGDLFGVSPPKWSNIEATSPTAKSRHNGFGSFRVDDDYDDETTPAVTQGVHFTDIRARLQQ